MAWQGRVSRLGLAEVSRLGLAGVSRLGLAGESAWSSGGESAWPSGEGAGDARVVPAVCLWRTVRLWSQTDRVCWLI